MGNMKNSDLENKQTEADLPFDALKNFRPLRQSRAPFASKRTSTASSLQVVPLSCISHTRNNKM